MTSWRPTPGTDPRQPEWRKLGASLQAARERAELSMKQVSIAVTGAETYYGMIERGQRRPSAELLLRLFDVLEMRSPC